MYHTTPQNAISTMEFESLMIVLNSQHYYCSGGSLSETSLLNHHNWCSSTRILGRSASQRASIRVAAASSEDLTTAQTAALASGAIFNPIVLYSEWTLFSTGKGLDPGPAGIYGALEGIGPQSCRWQNECF